MPNHSSNYFKRAAKIWYFLHRICPKYISMTYQIRNYFAWPSFQSVANNHFSIISNLVQFPLIAFVGFVDKFNTLKTILIANFTNWPHHCPNYSSYCYRIQHRLNDNLFLMFQLLFNTLRFEQ